MVRQYIFLFAAVLAAYLLGNRQGRHAQKDEICNFLDRVTICCRLRSDALSLLIAAASRSLREVIDENL